MTKKRTALLGVVLAASLAACSGAEEGIAATTPPPPEPSVTLPPDESSLTVDGTAIAFEEKWCTFDDDRAIVSLRFTNTAGELTIFEIDTQDGALDHLFLGTNVDSKNYGSSMYGEPPTVSVKDDVWSAHGELLGKDFSSVTVDAVIDCRDAVLLDDPYYATVPDAEFKPEEWKLPQNHDAASFLRAPEPLLIIDGTYTTSVKPIECIPSGDGTLVGVTAGYRGIMLGFWWVIDGEGRATFARFGSATIEDGDGPIDLIWSLNNGPAPTVAQDGSRYALSGTLRHYDGTSLLVHAATTCEDAD